jgi:hypothetical protein
MTEIRGPGGWNPPIHQPKRAVPESEDAASTSREAGGRLESGEDADSAAVVEAGR